jgi:hypothetical protein
MNKPNLEKYLFIANLISLILVVSSVGLIIFGAIEFIVPRNNTEILLKVSPPKIIDSIQIRKELETNISANIAKNYSNTSEGKNSFSYEINLKSKNINDVQKENQYLYKKIDTLLIQFQKKQELILKERENRESYISFTTALMTIIIALAGFFGFKSIHEMKLKAIEAAEEEAKSFLRTKESEIENLYEEKISIAVNKKIKTLKMLDEDNVKSIIKNEIEILEKQIQTLNLEISKCCPEMKRKNNDTTSTELNNEDTIEEDALTENNNDNDDLYNNVDLTK